MNSDTMHTFARARSLALAAMIGAGGKPVWIAAGPSHEVTRTAPATGPLTDRERAKLAHLPPRVLDRLSTLLSHLPPATAPH